MTPEPIALLFPGQGTQKQGMGEPWRDTRAWDLVEQVSERVGEDVAELLLHTGDALLRRTDLAQLAVFTVDVMAHDEARRSGLWSGAPVVACAGHSLGEFAALVAAGALGLADAAGLVAVRGRAMRDAAELFDGTMGVLVGAPLPAVEALVADAQAAGHRVWVANANAPGQVVLSGSVDGVAAAAAEAPGIGAKLIRVPVGGAFHSPLMAPAAVRLRTALAGVAFAGRHTPVVANVDARPHGAGADWPVLTERQLVSPVLWEAGVRTLVDGLGCTRLIELGPGRTLAGMVRRIAPAVEVLSVDSPEALAALASGRSGRVEGARG
ncbi:ACP S-malonyltransferase [Kitasatospora sp. NPDC089913]|uniref:ACP S-malonyltransferase n=1 Tax=Kitasatospora sp. NPDC089913 TaxID=3364080 RepID=UPI0037F2C15A